MMPAHGREHGPGGRDPIPAHGFAAASVLTANVNDYAPPNWSVNTMIMLASDSHARAIGGFQQLPGGTVRYLHNASAFNITLLDEQSTSDASNRLALTAPLVLVPDGFAIIQYDSVAHRWRAAAWQGRGIVSPAQLTGNVNNYNPTGLNTAGVLRLDANSAYSITGIAAPAVPTALDTCWLLLVNISASDLTLVDESASSTAANRFALVADYVIKPEKAVLLFYDATRWRIVGVQVHDLFGPEHGDTAITPANITGKGVDLTHAAGVQSVASATTVPFDFDTETTDAGGYHAGGSPSRITIPTGADGWYVITGGTKWVGEAHAGTLLDVFLRKNGAGVVPGSRRRSLPVTANFATQGLFQGTDKVMYLAAADYVELCGLHDDADAIDVDNREGGFSAVMVAA